METQYIEAKNNQLYSVYHEPSFSANNTAGVVLCNPIGHEYIRCYKLYTVLAKNLAKEGFHVLRFDYANTGNSEGDFINFTLQDAISNIAHAVQELKESCGLSKVFTLGARLGANLALQYALLNNTDGLVLWNPIVSGNDYLKEINTQYNEWLSGTFTKEKIATDSGINCFGFHYSGSLVDEIKSVSLSDSVPKFKIPLMQIDQNVNHALNIENLEYVNSIHSEFWVKSEDMESKTFVPLEEIKLITNWLKSI